MRAVNRTAQCKKCGSVNLTIEQNIGSAFYNCAQCNSEVAQVECEKYETLLSTCMKCGKDIFKVWITVDKEKSYEYWKAECSNCKSTHEIVYVDNKGNLINEEEYKLLLMKDKIEELEEENENNESIINSVKYENKNFIYEIEEKDIKIYSLERELDSANEEIKDLERKVLQLEDEVYDLECEINRYR